MDDTTTAEPQPTVREIIAELDHPTAAVMWCVNHPSGTRQDPLCLWVEGLAGWINFDGSKGVFALRGHARYTGLNRRRIAAACKRWSKKHG